jgi:2,4-dienoyl-CoA reductase-like NADH-dependent reductase (Old Yellow Enzyme family)
MYSSHNGHANDWHLVHLGARAVGGFALVMVEATAVEARGRISPDDAGIWSDDHIEGWAKVARFIKSHGAVPGIQLAHAGRKASVARPWGHPTPGKSLTNEEGGWDIVGPSPIPFAVGGGWRTPHELSANEIHETIANFARAAQRAVTAGFELIELHGAHGYLMHSFLSPLSNHRTDRYGGSFENRIRFATETANAVRKVWPDKFPLFTRLSCTDWTDGGWDLKQSIQLARTLKPLGVDLIDCSSGGAVPNAKITLAPGYQVQFAHAIKQQANIATAAVGMITTTKQADAILRENQADLVLLGREALREPYFPVKAAKELGVTDFHGWPGQYGRA